MLNLQFEPFPTLLTERLILRQIQLDDAERLFSMRSSEKMMAFIQRPRAKTLEDATKLIESMQEGLGKKESIVWVMSLKNDPEMIGTIGFWRMTPEHFRAEIGYLLHADYWQQGIAYEALVKVLEYGFNVMNCHSIEANIDPKNTASQRLLEKAGFVKEAHFKEDYFWEGQFLDSAVYSKLSV